MKKRIWSGILCCSMVAMLMAGCAKQNPTQTQTKDTSQEVSEEVGPVETTEDTQVAEEEEGTLRQTAFGPVQGYEDTTNQVIAWKGVPYAKAPVGELRWKAPQDPEAWTEALDATKPGNVGIQIANGELTGSEDCLNLDIYRPNSQETDLPVIVFVHGGNNQSGQSGEIAGETLANDANCIFISINYRLGALGFNCLPSLKTGDANEDSGNYTMLDIAKALDWVNTNIKEFGGDADNITITGFSAGGRDVMAMLISPLFADKFDKAISFSGGMTIADTDASVKTIAKALAPLVVEDKVKETEEEANVWLQTSDAEVKDYLYSISEERLATVMNNAGIRMSVFPHLYNDGTVLPKEGFETTTYNSVPLLMLTATSEFTFFAAGSPYFGASFGDGSVFTDETKKAEYMFTKKYGSLLYQLFNAQESAQTMSDNYKAPIYTCTISYGENAEVAGNMASFGAFHGVFVPLLDKSNASYQTMYPDAYATNGVQDLGKQFRAYIKNFIYTEDPNGEGLATWSQWSKNDAGATLVLDADKDKAIIQMEDRLISYDEVLTQIEQDTTISNDAKNKIIKEVLNGRWFSSKLDEHFENASLWVQ